jgi:hypothetical protein
MAFETNFVVVRLIPKSKRLVEPTIIQTSVSIANLESPILRSAIGIAMTAIIRGNALPRRLSAVFLLILDSVVILTTIYRTCDLIPQET